MAARNTTYDYMNDSHRSYKCSLEGWREHRRSARLSFQKVVNGIPVSSPDIALKSVPTTPALDALGKCKDLAIDICCGNDPISICAVQDMFFAFVDRIPKDHCLRSLAVTITIVLPNDNNERSWIVSDVWPSAFLKNDIIQENKALQPGDLSRMHMLAFLTDPLRKIRRLGGGGEVKQIKFTFSGSTGKVWKEIPIVVTDLVCGETDVKDYEIFRRYFEDLRHLTKSIRCAIKNVERLKDEAMSDNPAPDLIESPTSAHATVRSQEVIDLTIEENEVIDLTADESQASSGLLDLRTATKTLAMARIRGSFQAMRVGHHSLLEVADTMLLAASRWSEDEHFVRVLESLAQIRDYAASIFPGNVDISHYGYNESDIKLAECRSDPEGYVLRRSKDKPKRKKARGLDA